MNPTERQRIARLATALAQRDVLQQAPADRPVLPADIAAFAAGRDGAMADAVATALSSDLSARRLYRELLGQKARAHSGLQACAQDSAEVVQREGDGFEIRFRSSRADPHQRYVTLVMKPSHPLPEGTAVQLHVLGDDTVLRLDFPPLIDQTSQRLFSSDSLELAMLRRDDTEILLVTP